MNLYMPVRGGMHNQSVSNWTPADLPDLYMWFDAQDSGTITKDGSNYVTQWNDKKNGYHLSTTGTTGPIYNSSSINSKAALEFGGTTGTRLTWSSGGGLDFLKNQGLISIITVLEHTTRATSRVFYGWAKNGSTSSTRLGIVDYNSTGRLTLYIRQQDADSLYATNSNATYPLPEDTPLIHRLSIDYSSRYPNQYTSYHGDSVDIAQSSALPDGDSVQDTSSGAGGVGNVLATNSAIYKLGEMICVRDVLSAGEIMAINSYLRNKWGIS